MKVKSFYRSHVVFRIMKPCSLVGDCIAWLTQNSKCQVLCKETVQKKNEMYRQHMLIFVVTPCMLSSYSIIIPTTAHI